MTWSVLIILLVSLLLLGALGLALIRLLRGPSLPDRVVALDLISAIGVSLVAAYAMAMDQPVFLDVTVVLALISFLGTVAFAYYLERRTKNARGD
ncbi:MAG: cation:proton antiporter [Anaerolineales bacterium]|nr:cation:proton antiporter [Anaerolineales bacterium]